MSLPRLLLRLIFGRRLPITDGDLTIEGPRNKIIIRRNQWGVPVIEAENDLDAVFGLGFCHGQDRASQIEVFIRLGRGRLAEWVGPAGLPSDRLSRRIGFWRSAKEQWKVLAPDLQQLLEAYSWGVNAGRRQGLPSLPHEFAFLKVEPLSFEAPDVLTILKLQSFSLASNWDVELGRLRLLMFDGPEAVQALDPLGPITAEPNAMSRKLLAQFERELASLCEFLTIGGGSNNWVVSGRLTASGQPLLANDPHLAPTVPPPWYVACLQTPERGVSGAGLPGTPAIVIGHNGYAAWGVTAALTDNTDLFIETLGADFRSVRQSDGAYHPCEVIEEVVSVKGQRDVIEEILVTSRGPIITPLLHDVRLCISLRAVWLEARPTRGFLDASRATSYEAFRSSFDEWPVLPLNIVYADAGGTVGWLLAGQVPIRSGGPHLLPQRADMADSAWSEELLAFNKMPFVKDPKTGFLATANNSPFQIFADTSTNLHSYDSAEYQKDFTLLGYDFVDDYRYRAISEELGKAKDWDVPMSLRLQTNVRSLPWEELRARILSLEPLDSDSREALSLLQEWDGQVAVNSAAASVFELFLSEMCVRTSRAKAPHGWRVALGESPFGPLRYSLFTDRRIGHVVRLMRSQPADWLVRPWPVEMADALSSVVRYLRHHVGPSPAYWGWGHLRRLKLFHSLFRRSGWLGAAFNLGPFPSPGDTNTIFQAGTRPSHPTAFTHNIPNLRVVIDLADFTRSRFVLCGGQSGNPCSPHYDDLLPLWQAGDAVPLPWDRNASIKEAVATLRLVPASNRAAE